MPSKKINEELIRNLEPTGKQFEIRDTELKGFLIRVNHSGSLRFVCEYARGKRITIGPYPQVKPAMARKKALKILSDAKQGIFPKATKPTKAEVAKQEIDEMTLGKFLSERYAPWAECHLKSHKETLARINLHFIRPFGKIRLRDINLVCIEDWRIKRLKSGIRPVTVNRDVDGLKPVLSKAVEWGYLDKHPLAGLKKVKVEDSSRVRFLDDDERQRLHAAIEAREQRLRKERASANAWRKERGYALYPELAAEQFADHLKPLILISLNTGLRKGELMQVKWDYVDFNSGMLVLPNDITKSRKTRHVPLNKIALGCFKQWRQQTTSTGYVFTNPDGSRMQDAKKAWLKVIADSDIENFRWHDMRHDFASRLVMASVDLNTVRELLGHSDIKMTLRYAHLAPEHKANAVAKLVNAW